MMAMTAIRLRWFRLSGGAAFVLAVAAVGWFAIPYPTDHVHPSYGVSLETPAEAAGWADDVFVGRVEQQLGVERANDLPVTTYRITVHSTLKGQVQGSVKVAQEGGDDPVRRQRVVVGEAPPLQVGATYVLATRVHPNGWHNEPSNFTPIQVGGPDDARLEAWRQGVQSPATQQTVPRSSAQTVQDPGALYAKARA